jgi:hypothetical protein
MLIGDSLYIPYIIPIVGFICDHLDCLFQLIIDPKEEEAPVVANGIYL